MRAVEAFEATRPGRQQLTVGDVIAIDDGGQYNPKNPPIAVIDDPGGATILPTLSVQMNAEKTSVESVRIDTAGEGYTKAPTFKFVKTAHSKRSQEARQQRYDVYVGKMMDANQQPLSIEVWGDPDDPTAAKPEQLPTIESAASSKDPAVKEWNKVNKKELDNLKAAVQKCKSSKTAATKQLDAAKKTRGKEAVMRDKKLAALQDTVNKMIKNQNIRAVGVQGSSPEQWERVLQVHRANREAAEQAMNEAKARKARINAEGGADAEQRIVDDLESLVQRETEELERLKADQVDASNVANKNQKSAKEKEYAARVSLIKAEMVLMPVIDDTIARNFIRDHKGPDGKPDTKDGDYLVWVSSKRPKAFEVTVYHSCFGGEGKTANFRQIELTAKVSSPK